MKTTLLTLMVAATIGAPACAQIPFLTMDSININKINASVLVHGDMWWNPANYTVPMCTFPNGTKKSIGGPGAIWMSGYDGSGTLHVAAQTYRQNGNDYWPGPLSDPDTLTYHTSHDWARIWKINRSDIEYFLSFSSHTTANTPPMILTWPGKGSAYAKGNGDVALTVATDMAPFVDINSNGVYEPLLGDYPDIKGDQALWWVFSDNGPAHSQTNGKPLKVEVQAMAYAYSRGTLIDNVVYYDYTLVNRSGNTYNNFRFALHADIELGYFLDDYVGFDSSWRLGIQYNSTADDGSLGGHPAGSYGQSSPVVGVTFVSLPGDAGTTHVPAGSFIYYNDDASIMGNPATDTQYNYNMRSRMRNGQQFRNDFAMGIGPGPLVNYVFPGDPADNSQWSECAANDPSGDRRFILSSNDFTLPSGSSQHIVMALVTTDTGRHNACGTTGFSYNDIKIVADTAWKIYQNPPPPKTTSVSTTTIPGFNIYPNPVTDILYIATVGDANITIVNALGQNMNVSYSRTASEIAADVSNQSPGVYCLLYNAGSDIIRRTFVKQ